MKTPPPADWITPERTCIIAATERSGSRYLCDLMRQTERLGFPQEYFSPYTSRIIGPEGYKNIVTSCHLAKEFGQSGNGVLSIKLFPAHFAELQQDIELRQWFGSPRWVWLRRSDLLGQAISFSIALQTNQWRSDSPIKKKASYSHKEIYHRIKELAHWNNYWELYFARTGIEPLRIWYEDLESNPDETVIRIGNFVGVDLETPAIISVKNVKKQRTSVNNEWRERFISDFGNPDKLMPEIADVHGQVRNRISRWDRLKDKLRRKFLAVKHR